jgi:hypothetical protein
MSLGIVTATIANGASLSGVVELGDDETVLGLTTDTAWDTNALTFAVSSARASTSAELDALVFTPLSLADGNEATVVGLAASESVAVPDFWLKGYRWFKVRSGTAAAAANQTGATTITLSIRDVG